jgi:hypothetical protein
MKKKLTIAISLAGLISAFTFTTATLAPVVISTGCATNSNPAGTNVDQQVISTVSIILHGAALSGATYAIHDDANNAAYFSLAANALGEFGSGHDYTPQALQAAILKVLPPDYQTNQWVTLGISAVIDLYNTYWSDYAQNAVNGNAYAKAFVSAIQDGFNEALGKPVSLKLSARKAAAPKAKTALLPRPLPRKR